MYKVEVTGNILNWHDAIAEAKITESNIIEIKTGLCRWQPAPPVSKSRMQRYKERLAAFKAQECNGV